MKNLSNRSRTAFTLIELLIVVTILGIIAAIVIPRFSDASAQAKVDAQRAQLQQIRRQIELYRLDYSALPDLVSSWTPMTTRGTHAGRPCGPYFQNIPKNTANLLTTVVNGTGAAPAASACGFVYDYNAGNGTGGIKATRANGTAIFE